MMIPFYGITLIPYYHCCFFDNRQQSDPAESRRRRRRRGPGKTKPRGQGGFGLEPEPDGRGSNEPVEQDGLVLRLGNRGVAHDLGLGLRVEHVGR